MPRLTYYSQGDWNGCCDQCGRGFKFSQLSKRWDGAYACAECWEPRHPQDFLRAVRDDPSVPVARPRLNLPVDLQFSANDTSILSWTNATGASLTWSGS